MTYGLTVDELVDAYRARRLSPVEVVRDVLARADSVDRLLNALAYIRREEAIDEARAAERLYQDGSPVMPLLGVPVTVKDMAPTVGIPTTYGSRLTGERLPDEDAPIVERLRRAGAIIVGKTTTPEFGFLGATQSPLLGVSRNPWDATQNPGGSSGGAAIAAATRVGPLHTGGDGGGSIRIPASLCGVFGIKPSLGLVPTYPASASGPLGTLGPIARHVDDDHGNSPVLITESAQVIEPAGTVAV